MDKLFFYQIIDFLFCYYIVCLFFILLIHL